jgi:LytS/YehU family sensor histidine kinase
MIASKSLMAVLGLAYTSFIARPLYRRLLDDGASALRTISVTAAVSYGVAILWTATHSALDIFLVEALLHRPAHITSFWQIFGGTLYDAFIILSWSVLYVGIRQQRALYAERERSLRAESLAQEARLDALRFQLNPHFLFNALNAISTLVMDGRRDEATQMIARLADLLRATLHRPANEDITLEAELELVQRYLDIERARLADRLRVEIDAGQDVLDAQVPSLIMQPLVENAVKYAVASRPEGGRIQISVRRVGDVLHAAVEDDGPGAPNAVNGNGVGLENVRSRLQHRYGARQRFTLARSNLGGLSVLLELPYRV